MATATLAAVVAACGPDTTSAGSQDASSSDTGDTSGGASTDTTTLDADTSTTVVDTSGGASEDDATSVATDTSSTGDSSPEGPVCGDGRVEGDEGCDDGNVDDDDECDSDCVPTAAIRWTASYAGADGQADCATRVAVAPSDLAWVAGYVRNPAEAADGWVGQLDTSGSWTWHSTFVGEGHENDVARGLAIDVDGNAYVGGTFTQNGDHLWLRRVTEAGAEVWTQTWSDGERGSEIVDDLALDADALRVAVKRDAGGPNLLQGWSFAGELGDSVAFDSGELAGIRVDDLVTANDGSVWGFGVVEDSELPVMLRFDPAGMFAQATVLDTPTTTGFGDESMLAGDVGVTGMIALLTYDQPAGGDVPTIRVFASDTTLLAAWLVEIDGDPRAHDIAVDASDRVVVAGERFDLPWVRKFDAAGEALWDRMHTPLGGSGSIEAVAIAEDDDVVVAGCNDIGANRDVWVRRYAP